MTIEKVNEIESELIGVVARCGFVPNPTMTMDGNRVNPPDIKRLHAELLKLFGVSGVSDATTARRGAKATT